MNNKTKLEKYYDQLKGLDMAKGEKYTLLRNGFDDIASFVQCAFDSVYHSHYKEIKGYQYVMIENILFRLTFEGNEKPRGCIFHKSDRLVLWRGWVAPNRPSKELKEAIDQVKSTPIFLMNINKRTKQ